MNRLNQVHSPQAVKKLFSLCWLVYCISYMGRLNYSAAMTVMIKEHILSSGQAGLISMAYFLAYGIGQLINGFLGDKAKPEWMIVFGMSMSAVTNFGMGISTFFWTMALLWGMNGYFQSMIWAPIIRIFAEMMDEEDKLSSSVNITSSGVVGTLLSYFLSAALLACLPWHFTFYAASVLLLFIAIIFYCGFTNIVKNSTIETDRNPCSRQLPDEKMIPAQNSKFGALLIQSSVLCIVIPAAIHGILKDGITAWVPVYISENFGLTASFSILLTTILPVINLTGAYAGWALFCRLKKNVGRTIAVFFAGSGLALLLLLLWGSLSAIFAVIMLAVITSSMMAINTLIIGVYPLKFEKMGRVSSVSGFLNAMAYLGTAISTLGIGILLQYRGWKDTIFSWLVLTILAMVSCLMFAARLATHKDS